MANPLSSLINIDALGSDISTASKTNVVPDSLIKNLQTALARPHRFLTNADPSARTFVRHMLPAAPLVMIRPGRVKFSEDTTTFLQEVLNKFGRQLDNKDAVDDLLKRPTEDADGRSVPGGLFNSLYGVDKTDLAAMQQAINDKQKGTVGDFVAKNNKSIRYFEFNSNNEVMKEYRAVFHTLVSRLYSRMMNKVTPWADLRGKYDPPEMSNGGFWTLWADNATSVSESASSEVGATKLAGLVKGVSEVSREAQFFLGSQNFGAWKSEDEKKGMIDSAIGSVAEFISGPDQTAGLRASLGDAILGMNPMFPEVWKDSSFSRSYTLNFKFHSPYGHPQAVYQNVLLPFTMLLSMVMPVMTNPGTYSEPFVFQLDCPGYFACDLGICTDFSFTKGGSENLWTVDGLPRQIDVNMSVKDLYPVLVASKNAEAMYFNVGMGTFLDNLAGISIFKSSSGEADFLTRLRANVNSGLGQIRGTPDRWVASGQQFLEQTGVAGLFRAISG